MTLVWLVSGGFLLLLGLIGCIVPVLPGPILAYCGLLTLVPTVYCPSTPCLIVMGAITVLVTLADYIVPAMGAKKFNCSRWGTTGCFVGTIIGLFFVPIGLVLGPFLGALIGELIAGKKMHLAVQGGFGALLGFLSGIAIKLAACLMMTAYFVFRLFG